MSARTEKLLLSLVLSVLLGGGFFAVAGLDSARTIAPPPWLATALDARIPLVPSFVWLYLSWYPATALVLFANRDNFRRAYVAYAIAFLCCAAGYVLVPVAMARPVIPLDSGASASALAMLYAVDPPRNIFPSFHAAIAAVLWQLRPTVRVWSMMLSAWAIGIGCACVLTKQHFVLDVIAGAGVGIAAARVSAWWFSSAFTTAGTLPSRAAFHRHSRADPA